MRTTPRGEMGRCCGSERRITSDLLTDLTITVANSVISSQISTQSECSFTQTAPTVSFTQTAAQAASVGFAEQTKAEEPAFCIGLHRG
ncbi:unnamed protein product [Toxocara canis]|uniref:Uncharacterized protein n=1 Tax=Toxocara canis TaxID=6265 RepID=A0A183UAD5_TOXCA|nr:unnamed protein product [Toxocara canis]